MFMRFMVCQTSNIDDGDARQELLTSLFKEIENA